MGSQLRFDPSFFGLALRAAAEADALFFSAHKDLPITRCPTRAGLRLTSPAKASGESDVQKSVHIKKPPRRVSRHTRCFAPATRASCLASRSSPHCPTVLFQASRVTRVESSIQIKRGRSPQRRTMVSGAKIANRAGGKG